MKSKPIKVLIAFVLLFSLFGSALTVSPAHAAGLCYVNDNAGGTNTGGSWTNAYTSLQSAIADSCTEIWVAAGTYKPHASNRAVSFALETGTAIYGGFAGTETLRTERNPTANLTTLSGDLLGNDSGFTNNDENSFHVVTGSGLTNTAVLDGFTIRGGNAFDFSTEYNGGGIHLSNSSPMLANLVITNNNAREFGGGIYTSNGSPTLTEVTFNGNYAGSYGGGMYSNSSSPTFSGVTFNANSVSNLGHGGGMYNDSSSPTLTNVTFNGNSTGDDVESGQGAGMYNINNSNVTITNATFSNNTAPAAQGGGIYNTQSTLTITNATFSGNSAIAGGGISKISGNATLTNVTFSGNAGAYYGGGIENQFSNSLILVNVTFSGNSAGTGGGLYNTGTATLTNTLLANNPGGDCVKSGGGNIAAASNNLIKNTGTSACGLVNGSNGNIIGSDPNLGALTGSPAYFPLNTGSFAIDAGTNTGCPSTSQNGITRPQGGACDIGSFEIVSIPTVTASNPSAGATLTSLSSITVVFNQDMLDNATADGAENVNNYILVERGTNGVFNTVSCNGGVLSDDVQKTISAASYNSAGFITVLTLASPLTTGTYRLFICGTTSIWSVTGLELNNGASDATVNFTITGTTGSTTSASTVSTTASSLPKTGFAPNKVTTLPTQPAELAYAELGDLWLEIPSLNVKSNIVGVPQNKDKTWDVTWLGNDTGWLNGTAFPTWTGNSVLTAHVTNASGVEGPFAALKQVKYGDQIIVHMGGVKYVYEVRETKLSRPYATSYAFESKQDASYITLVTCSGYNPLNESYLFRRVVRAVLIEVK